MMTNKYSEFSDFEVNKLVAKELYWYSSRYFVGDTQHGDDVEIFTIDSGKVRHYTFFNILEDDSTVFALMIDNEISLNKHGKKWRASKMFLINGKLELGNIKSFIVIHENPCRAIAECFLSMKDAEKNNETKTL